MARTSENSSRNLESPILSWESQAVAWLDAKERADEAKKEMSQYYSDLMEALDDQGVEDDKGHRTLELTHPVGKYAGLQRQRRVSVGKDEDTIMAILKEKNLESRCIQMVPQIDEDAVMACLWEGLLTEDEIYAMFPEKVTYALVAVKQ